MKLGEILIEEGRLDRGGLKRALSIQTTLGGRLGTNLVELGLVEERHVLAALGRQKSATTVDRADLQGIPDSELNLIPPKLAQRYGVIPYERSGKTLQVAARDPADLLVEDEIAFLTGCMIRTSVALDLHILEALNRYYGIPLSTRYEVLFKQLGSSGGRIQPPKAASAQPGGRPERVDPEEIPESLRPEEAGGDRRREPSAERPVADDLVKPAPDEPPRPEKAEARMFIELSDEDRSAIFGGAREAAPEEPASREAEAAEAPSTAPAPPPAPPVVPGAFVDLSESWPDDESPGVRLDHAARMMQEAEIRDDIADALLGFCEPYATRRLMLIKRKDKIVGWRGRGEGLERTAIRQIELSLTEPSVLLGLLQGGEFWLGPIPTLPANKRLAAGLGGRFPKDCFVLPIALRQQVVAFLYGDNAAEGVTGAPLPELRRLVAKAGLAFEVYILKNKIRSL